MKRNLVLMSLIVLVGLTAAVPASAQGVAFQASSLTKQARAIGRTENVGEITLLATNSGTVLAGSSITVVYGATITSAPDLTGVACSACAGGDIAVTSTGNQLTISFINAVAFTAFADTISIAKVRVNAAGAGSVGTTIAATMSGTSSNPVTNPITFTTSQVQVAILENTIDVDFTAGGPVLTCGAVADSFEIDLAETFPAALTSVGRETAFSDTPVPATGVRVVFTFTGVPSGLSITAPSPVGIGTLTLTFVAGTTATQESNSTNAGTISYTYDVTLDDSGTVEASSALVAADGVVFTVSDPDGDLVLVGGTATVAGDVSIAPVDNTSPFTVISFATNSQGADDVLTVADCNTLLLFPFVANVAGFDTGVAIANTTADGGIGATAQDGTCSLVGWDAATGTATSALVTPVIASGETYLNVLSATTEFQGFSGYIIANCGFLNAHAFAFITDNFGVSAPATAQGYLALIIGNTGSRVIPAGESLGQ